VAERRFGGNKIRSACRAAVFIATNCRPAAEGSAAELNDLQLGGDRGDVPDEDVRVRALVLALELGESGLAATMDVVDFAGVYVGELDNLRPAADNFIASATEGCPRDSAAVRFVVNRVACVAQ
jgi:hypothetical protein